MALGISFDVHQKNGCKKLLFKEKTGVYDASLNLTGYGTPNATVASATAWSIVITRPDATVITITNPVGLPTSNTALEYEIAASTINSTWVTVSDGYYTFVYSVTADGVTYTSTKYFLFTCNLDCCVYKMFKNIAVSNDCSCDSIAIKNALYASALLEGLKASVGCGIITNITSLLTKLNTICGFTESDCGCS